MGSHPVNLTFRFLLELVMLIALGDWGARRDLGVLRWGAAVALPLAAATLWGVFAVPDDPSRSGDTVIATPGWIRLLLELSLFACAVGALAHGRSVALAVLLGAGVTLHYALSYDRIQWLTAH